MEKRLLLASTTLLLLASCGQQAEEGKELPLVNTVTAEQVSAPTLRSYTFISEPYRQVDLSFRVGGPVKTFDVQSGQHFSKGQLIAAIDERDFLIRKERAEALYRQAIEQIQLPPGYTFFWDSQYKDQREAMQALTKFFPLALVFLALILVALFGNFRQPLIIFLILPLSVIGVVIGLLPTGFQFGFFCIAGWLGLLGMIIKNVIVLIDEVNAQRRAGVKADEAIVEATVSRTRPVLMAAITTIMGSIPLLFDVVFGGMAATIVFGLTFATLLTLFVTPALYAVFYPEAAGKSMC